MRCRCATRSIAAVLGDCGTFRATFEFRPPRNGMRLTLREVVFYMKLERNEGVMLHWEGYCDHRR